MIPKEGSNESYFIGEDESIVIHFFFISESYCTYIFRFFFFSILLAFVVKMGL